MSGTDEGDTPPSFLPEGGGAGSRPTFAQPPSFAPRGRSPQRRRVQARPARRAGGSSSTVTPRSYPSALREGPPRRVGPSRLPASAAGAYAKPRGRHGGRVAARFIALLLALIILLAAGFYIWMNSQLQHMTALSDAPGDAARSWLILGSDARDGSFGQTSRQVPGERTDTIMLLVKPHSGPAALISIPRDSYVESRGVGLKINSVAEENGWPALTAAVEKMTGVKVDHVVKIGFSGIKSVVDAMGGVTLCYDRTVSDPFSGLKWTAGCHPSDGATALAFSRMRHGDPMGDLGRARRQRILIQAMAKKALSPGFLLGGRAPATLSAGLRAVRVDEHSSPLSLAQMALTFRSATSSGGITGMPVLTSMGTPIYPLGSCVLVNREETLSLFDEILDGTHAPGVVGGLPNQ